MCRAAAALGWARILIFLVVYALPGNALAELSPGGIFQVNTYTTGAQAAPASAIAADGTLIVVWESEGQDGDDLSVFGQRYNSIGGAIGTEFQVNSITVGRQVAPAVVAAADGSFMVVWQSYELGGDFDDVFVRRYSSSGTPLGSEFQVNTSLFGYQAAPAVAASPTGAFVVVWHDYYDVFGQRFSSSGAAIGTTFQVNTYVTGYQLNPSIAVAEDSSFVVAWTDGYYYLDGQDGYGYGVFGQRYDSAGMPVGTEFQVNTIPIGDQYRPNVAGAASGAFVVVWESYSGDGYYDGVYGQRYDASGNPAGTEFPIDTGNSLGSPAVAAGASGEFVVVWNAFSTGNYNLVVLGQRYGSAGLPAGAEFQVGQGAIYNQLDPVIGLDAEGNVVVVWESSGADGSDSGIFAQQFSVSEATATVSSTPTPTATSTITNTPLPTNTSTRSFTGTPTTTATPTLAANPTETVTPSPTRTFTSTQSAVPTSSRTPTATPTHSTTPTGSDTPDPTITPTWSPSTTATAASGTASATATITTSPTPTTTPHGQRDAKRNPDPDNSAARFPHSDDDRNPAGILNAHRHARQDGTEQPTGDVHQHPNENTKRFRDGCADPNPQRRAHRRFHYDAARNSMCW